MMHLQELSDRYLEIFNSILILKRLCRIETGTKHTRLTPDYFTIYLQQFVNIYTSLRIKTFAT
jgi:hypothetical protein